MARRCGRTSFTQDIRPPWLSCFREPDDCWKKDYLIRSVWPDSYVQDANLSVHIATLRKIFGEDLGCRTVH